MQNTVAGSHQSGKTSLLAKPVPTGHVTLFCHFPQTWSQRNVDVYQRSSLWGRLVRRQMTTFTCSYQNTNHIKIVREWGQYYIPITIFWIKLHSNYEEFKKRPQAYDYKKKNLNVFEWLFVCTGQTYNQSDQWFWWHAETLLTQLSLGPYCILIFQLHFRVSIKKCRPILTINIIRWCDRLYNIIRWCDRLCELVGVK